MYVKWPALAEVCAFRVLLANFTGQDRLDAFVFELSQAPSDLSF